MAFKATKPKKKIVKKKAKKMMVKKGKGKEKKVDLSHVANNSRKLFDETFKKGEG